MIIFRNKYCTITCTAETSLLQFTWHSQPNLRSLLKLCNIGYDVAAQYRIRHWLIDNRKGINFDLAMQRELAELAASRLAGTCLSRMVMVVPLDVFYELVSYRIYQNVNQLITNVLDFEVFSELGTATAWLVNGRATAASA